MQPGAIINAEDTLIDLVDGKIATITDNRLLELYAVFVWLNRKYRASLSQINISIPDAPNDYLNKIARK